VKKVVLLLVAALMMSVLLIGDSLVPKSIRVSLAGVAGCDFPEERLKRDDPNFKGVQLWEIPFSYVQRIRYLMFPPTEIINDQFSDNITPLNLLLTSSTGYYGKCDEQILALFKRVSANGVSIDHYTPQGLTAIHEAVIFKRVEFLSILLKSGANSTLKTKYEGSINNMTALEIAMFFNSKKESEELTTIIKILQPET
jgi:hypothetical protein